MEDRPVKKRLPGVLLICLAGIAWSFAGILSKFAAWNAFTLAGFRSIMCALTLGLARRSFKPVNRPAVWIGAIGVAGTSVLFMLANKLTSAANAIVLQYAMPVFVVLYQFIALKKTPSRRETIVIGVVLLGVILCFCQGFSSGGMLGNILSLLSAVTWATVFIAARMPGCDAMASSYQGNLICTLLLLVMPFDPAVTAAPIPWLAALALGLALTFGYLFFSLGMSRGVPSVTAAIVSNIEPVLNPTWCFLFLGENPGPLSLIGAVVVLLAVTVYSIMNSRPART